MYVRVLYRSVIIYICSTYCWTPPTLPTPPPTLSHLPISRRRNCHWIVRLQKGHQVAEQACEGLPLRARCCRLLRGRVAGRRRRRRRQPLLLRNRCRGTVHGESDGSFCDRAHHLRIYMIWCVYQIIRHDNIQGYERRGINDMIPGTYIFSAGAP